MSIIYSYPIKGTPANDDLILISDSASSPQFATKQIKVSSLPGGSGSGVSSVTAVSPLKSTGGSTPAISLTGLTGFGTTGQVIKVNSNADGLEWGAAGGTPAGLNTQIQYNNNGSFGGSQSFKYTDSTKTLSIGDQDVSSGILFIGGGQNGGSPVSGQLKLGDTGTSGGVVTLKAAADISSGDYDIVLPSVAPGGNNKILESDASGNLSWITTPASTAPSGDDGQFQYKNGSSFAGTDTLRFDADKIHIGKGGLTPTRGQLVMYGDSTNASDIQLYNGPNNRFLKIAQQAGATQDLTLTFPGVAPGGNKKILQSDSSGQLSWIDTPSGSGISFSGTTANGIEIGRAHV